MTSFLPGDGFGMVSDRSVALVRPADHAPLDQEALDGVWRLVRDGEPVADVVRWLRRSEGGGDIDLGLVRVDGGRLDVVVWGRVVVELFGSGSGALTIDAGSRDESRHDRPDAFTIRGADVQPPGGRPPYEVDRGVVPARALHVRLDGAVPDAAGGVAPPRGSTADRVTASETLTTPVRRRPLVLVFDTGERVRVSTSVVIGRKPRAIEPNTGEPQALVVLDAAGKGLSRSHALVELDRGELRIVDLDSSNGIAVERDGEWLELAPNEAVPLHVGTRVDLGGAAQFVVEVDA